MSTNLLGEWEDIDSSRNTGRHVYWAARPTVMIVRGRVYDLHHGGMSPIYL
jgi:hypothetical protein